MRIKSKAYLNLENIFRVVWKINTKNIIEEERKNQTQNINEERGKSIRADLFL